VKVAVLGNGGFGTAMAMVALRGGHDVALWGHDADYTAEIARSRRNPRYLDSVEVPREIAVTADPAGALADAGAVLVGIPTQHMRATVRSVRPHVADYVPLISLAKGLEQGTGQRPTEILAEECGHPERVLALSGPSHAEEIAHGLPCTVVLAGPDEDLVAVLQEALSNPTFRIYRNTDVLGTELCGAVKNVMALAAGIADGLGYGDNAKAAIVTRGIVEMQRFGRAMGADPSTFFGLAGVGDLAVTAFSRHGRNRAFGERIGAGETLDEILASTRKVAEGVWTSRVVQERARAMGVEVPLCDAVCAVLFGGVPAEAAVRDLMQRDPKSE